MASLGWMLPGCRGPRQQERSSLGPSSALLLPTKEELFSLLPEKAAPLSSSNVIHQDLRRFFYPMPDGLVRSSQHSPGYRRTFLDQTLFSSCLWGWAGGGNLQNALASWESSFHTQKTYHPTLLARFQSLMTFVNHQPVCLHQRTLPTGTPFNTKAVAIPFKRGSLKAPLCSREQNKISSLQNFKPLEIMQQKAFCCVSFGKFEPSSHNIHQKNDSSAQGKQGTFGIKSSTPR